MSAGALPSTILHPHNISAKKQNGPQAQLSLRAARWTAWIDQEVVTLRGLYGNSGFLTDLRQAESILNSPVVCGL